MYRIRVIYYRTQHSRAIFATLTVIEADKGQTYEVLEDLGARPSGTTDTISTVPRALQTDCTKDVELLIHNAKKEIQKIRERVIAKEAPLPKYEEIEI